MSSPKQFKQGESAYGYSSETDHLVEFNKSALPKKKRQFWCYCSVVLAILLFVLIATGIGVGIGLNYGLQSTTLPSRITTSNLMKHLQDLEDIASSQPEHFSRAVQYGYDESADMVYNKLKDAGYEVEKQEFTVATYEENASGSSLSAYITSKEMDFEFNFIRSSQYSVMWYSQSTNGTDIQANLSVVEDSCNAANYTPDTIALIEYANESVAGCSLLNMTEAAAEGGALAVIMMRTEEYEDASPPGTRIYSQDGDDFRVSPLPAMGATYSLGSQLLDYIDLSDTGTVLVTMSTDTEVNFQKTWNVLAYTPKFESSDTTIVFGSHLDSVAAGPGINDNGSGSAANLEIALQIIKNGIETFNRVLFAFWGAEELGLLGSTYFVNNLSEDERKNYALNLNFDMIGSPNYVRQVYNGSGAENPNIVHASGKIQSLFEEYFIMRSLNYTLKEFNGRSDYGPFIAEGIDIPAGGLATGADEVKGEENRRDYGGLANAILDPCYHQSCDTVDNINQEVYLQMSQAAAYVLNELMSMEDLTDFLNS